MQGGAGLTKGLGVPQRIVVWFFLGDLLSLIDYDVTDYFFFRASAFGALSPNEQIFYYTILPTIVYAFIGLAAIALFRYHFLSPRHFVEMIFVSVVLIPAIAGLLLPQASDFYYVATVIGGTFATLVLFFGLLHDIRGGRRR